MEDLIDPQIQRKIEYTEHCLKQLDKLDEQYDKLLIQKIQQISELEDEVIKIWLKVDENNIQRKLLEDQLKNYSKILENQLEEQITLRQKQLEDLLNFKEVQRKRKFSPYTRKWIWKTTGMNRTYCY